MRLWRVCLHNNMEPLSRSSMFVMLVIVVVQGCSCALSVRPSRLGETPYSVVVRTHTVCSGVLTGRRYVLTAAHCFNTESLRNSSKSLVLRGVQNITVSVDSFTYYCYVHGVTYMLWPENVLCPLSSLHLLKILRWSHLTSISFKIVTEFGEDLDQVPGSRGYC